MSEDRDPTIHVYSGIPSCPICGRPLAVRLARGRKSGKPFVMFRCSHDGRHYRAFINDKGYVAHVLERLEAGQNQIRGDKA